MQITPQNITPQDMVSDQEFAELLDNAVEYVNTVVDGKSENMFATLILHRRKDIDEKFSMDIVVLADLPSTALERQEAIVKIAQMAGKNTYDENGKFRGAVSAIHFCTEVWLKKVKGNPPAKLTKLPSEYADREERIMVSGTTLDGRTDAAFFGIQRDNKNQITAKLKEYIPYKPGQEKFQQEQYILEGFFPAYARSFIHEATKRMLKNL